jgi:hypothetical protein
LIVEKPHRKLGVETQNKGPGSRVAGRVAHSRQAVAQTSGVIFAASHGGDACPLKRQSAVLHWPARRAAPSSLPRAAVDHHPR